jgi:hypothetical protein
MSEDDNELIRALDRLAETTRRREGGGHPAPRQLTAYQAGTLPPPEADAIQEHLAVCRHCAELLLDLVAFTAPQPTEATLLDQGEPAWHAPRSRRKPAPSPSAPVVLAGFQRLAASHPAIFALAAGTVGCLMGLPLWYSAWRPPANATFVSISPERGARAPLQPPAPTTVRLDSTAAVLILDTVAARSYPTYRVKLESATAGPVRSEPSWARIDARTFLVVLTYRQLPAGLYRLRVVGIEQGREVTVQEFPLRVLG